LTQKINIIYENADKILIEIVGNIIDYDSYTIILQDAFNKHSIIKVPRNKITEAFYYNRNKRISIDLGELE
jgi:uncharacterized protein YvpB